MVKASRIAESDIAGPAALLGEPARAAMLLALLGGDQLPASELAFRSGTSPQAASAHLKKLLDGGMIVCSVSGRHRLFRLASGDVAHALEALSALCGPAPVNSLSQSGRMQRLRYARSCYDHLAGRLGVAVTERLVQQRLLRLNTGEFALTQRGAQHFASLGIDVAHLRDERRAVARACMDWTERRPHLAGGLGASLLTLMLREKWVTRNASERSLSLTSTGTQRLRETFGLTLEATPR